MVRLLWCFESFLPQKSQLRILAHNLSKKMAWIKCNAVLLTDSSIFLHPSRVIRILGALAGLKSTSRASPYLSKASSMISTPSMIPSADGTRRGSRAAWAGGGGGPAAAAIARAATTATGDAVEAEPYGEAGSEAELQWDEQSLPPNSDSGNPFELSDPTPMTPSQLHLDACRSPLVRWCRATTHAKQTMSNHLELKVTLK